MKNLLKKMGSKQKLTIGVVISIFIITMVCLIVSKQNSPDKVVKEYCNILVNGNFGDILDLAYLPEGEFITKDKIEELKKVYFEKMQKEKNGITICTFTKANETDESIIYKLTMEKTNGKDTSDIEVRKADNKIVIDGLYKKKSLTVFEGSTVYVDNKEISIVQKQKGNSHGNQVETYTFTILDGVKYDVEITHAIFKDEVTTLDDDTNYTTNANANFTVNFSTEFKNDVNEMTTQIVTDVLEGKDTKSLNKYFSKNDAEEFIESNGQFKEIITETSGNYNYVFKGTTGTTIDKINYINDNELSLRMFVSCKRQVSTKNNTQIFMISDSGGKLVDSYEDNTGKQLVFTCIKKDGKWIISSWNNELVE